MPFKLKLLGGSQGFKYECNFQSGIRKKISFYWVYMRLWVEYSDGSDKGFTLIEFTRKLKEEHLAVMVISCVDGFNSNMR